MGLEAAATPAVEAPVVLDPAKLSRFGRDSFKPARPSRFPSPDRDPGDEA